MPTQQVAMAQCRCGKRVIVGENAIPLASDHSFSEGKSRSEILRHVSRIAPFNSQNPATSQDPVSPTSLSSPIFKQIRLETRLHYPLLEPWWPG
jgi:hypothetical protein